MAHSGESPRIVIIGAGMAGILSAIKLKEAGYGEVAVYEKAERLGGTWRENTYPGVTCDVPSHLYSYSFAPNPEWSHVFAPGAEVLAYFEDTARRFGVEGDINYGTEVVRLEHDGRKWTVSTADGETDRADIVIAATGVLHHPRYPDIAGLETFAGAMFHSARFDHRVSFEGAKVGIVGTGSTATQMVCALAPRVSELHLFQRTAQWVLPVPNPPIDEATKESYRRHPDAMRALHDELSQMFEQNFANAVVDADSAQMRVLEEMCQANLETVSDPVLRKKLRPTYRTACKRLIVSPDFYEKVQMPSVRLVTESIERVEAAGVRTRDSRLHELDVLILATGFQVDRFVRPIEVIGPGGVKLDDVWSARPFAYLSLSVPGFPNLFLLNGPNGPVGNFSLIEVAELQMGYVMQLIDHVVAANGRCRLVAPTQAATERFEAERVAQARKTVWMTGCQSWYLDDRGIPSVWPWTFDRFRREMSAPVLEHYER